MSITSLEKLQKMSIYTESREPQAVESAHVEYTPEQQAGIAARDLIQPENTVDGSGRDVIKTNQRSTGADFDSDLADRWAAEADAANAAMKARESLAEQNAQIDYDRLTSRGKRDYLERTYQPQLVAAKARFEAACDQLEEARTTLEGERLQHQIEYANNGNHPDVRWFYVSGPTHFKAMLHAGEFTKDGYKMIDTRNGGTNVICIPADVPNLMSYADSPEAKQYAEMKVSSRLASLENAQKRAAVELTELQNTVRQKWDAITDFESLFQSTVKRSSSKK